VRGNVSAQYGSQAIGGVVQLFSRSPTAGLKGLFSSELGTKGHKKVATSVGFGNADTQLRVSLSQLKLDGVTAQNPTQTPGVNPDADGTNQSSAQLAITHTVSPTIKLSASVMQSRQLSEYDGSSASATDTTKQSLILGQLGLAWNVMPNWAMKVGLSEQKGTGHDETANAATSDVSSRRRMFSFVNNVELGAAGILLAGFEKESNQFAAQSYGTYGSTTNAPERQLSALFVGLQGKQQALAWNLALRRDAEQSAAGIDANTYQLGLSYDLGKAWSVRGQTSTAFKRPTLNELYLPVYGNAALKSELAHNREVGVQWAQADHIVRATYFKSRVKDLIGSDPLSYQNINIDQSTNHGVELMAEIVMPWTAGKLKAGVTRQKPVDATTGELLQRRNRQHGNIGLQGALGQWLWGVQFSHQGKRNDVDYSNYPYNAVILKSYVKLDAQITYQWTKQLSTALSVSNLSAANDQTAYGYSGTPRGAVLRLNYKL
jgi:vitamin B12 transporter